VRVSSKVVGLIVFLNDKQCNVYPLSERMKVVMQTAVPKNHICCSQNIIWLRSSYAPVGIWLFAMGHVGQELDDE
jgi:hypothetical protein